MGLMGLFKKNRLKHLRPENEVDFAAVQIANIVRIRGVVLPEEIQQITKNLTEKQHSKLIAKLKKLKIGFKEDMLQYTEEMDEWVDYIEERVEKQHFESAEDKDKMKQFVVDNIMNDIDELHEKADEYRKEYL